MKLEKIFSMEQMITQDQIQSRVKELAQQIEQHEDKYNHDLPPVFICILNGAVMFFSDLMKNYHGLCEMDFLRAKSYNGRDNSGGVKILKDIEVAIQGKNVYIIEDIIDTGETMKEIYLHLSSQLPSSINIVTLLKRKEDDHPMDFYGFEINDEWVVGYGLDDNGLSRNLPAIYKLEQGE
jgi:hypoxanthine phosphoribosyltransferase